MKFTPIRVVCHNTLTLSLSTASKRAVRISHASVFDAEIVKETLGIAHEKFAEYKEMAEFLGSRRYSIDTLLQYYKEVFPYTTKQKGVENVGLIQKEEDKNIVSNNAKKCLELLDRQPGAEYAEGSWWKSFQLGYILHRPSSGKECRDPFTEPMVREEPDCQNQGFQEGCGIRQNSITILPVEYVEKRHQCDYVACPV